MILSKWKLNPITHLHKTIRGDECTYGSECGDGSMDTYRSPNSPSCIHSMLAALHQNEKRFLRALKKTNNNKQKNKNPMASCDTVKWKTSKLMDLEYFRIQESLLSVCTCLSLPYFSPSSFCPSHPGVLVTSQKHIRTLASDSPFVSMFLPTDPPDLCSYSLLSDTTFLGYPIADSLLC